MKWHLRLSRLVITYGFALLCAAPLQAQQSWEGETFLEDYSKLQPAIDKHGRDYVYLVSQDEGIAARYDSVMLDEPEVFISPKSPYKGAKPEDIATIAGLVRSSIGAALQQRGYKVVASHGANVLYMRVGVTGLKIDKKKRSLLSYTPVGFVVTAGVQGLQDFMEKYDILDVSVQTEIRDSVDGTLMAAGVMQRGASADGAKPIKFDALMAVATEIGERLACRLDNAHLPQAQRIDCSDADARKARPQVVGL